MSMARWLFSDKVHSTKFTYHNLSEHRMWEQLGDKAVNIMLVALSITCIGWSFTDKIVTILYRQ